MERAASATGRSLVTALAVVLAVAALFAAAALAGGSDAGGGSAEADTPAAELVQNTQEEAPEDDEPEGGTPFDDEDAFGRDGRFGEDCPRGGGAFGFDDDGFEDEFEFEDEAEEDDGAAADADL